MPGAFGERHRWGGGDYEVDGVNRSVDVHEKIGGLRITYDEIHFVVKINVAVGVGQRSTKTKVEQEGIDFGLGLA